MPLHPSMARPQTTALGLSRGFALRSVLHFHAVQDRNQCETAYEAWPTRHGHLHCQTKDTRISRRPCWFVRVCLERGERS